MSFATDVSVRELQRPVFAVISAAPSRCEGCASENYLYTEALPKIEPAEALALTNEIWSPTLEHSPTRDP